MAPNASPRRSHPSLHNLSVWAYLALAFIVLSVFAILVYAIYSCYHSSKKETSRPALTKWNAQLDYRSMNDSQNSRRSMIRRSTTSLDYKCDPPSLSGLALVHPVRFQSPAPYVPLQLPSSIYTYASRPRPRPPIYDSHDIRFVHPREPYMSPSTALLWANPKLSPIQGSLTTPIGLTSSEPSGSSEGTYVASDYRSKTSAFNGRGNAGICVPLWNIPSRK